MPNQQNQYHACNKTFMRPSKPCTPIEGHPMSYEAMFDATTLVRVAGLDRYLHTNESVRVPGLYAILWRQLPIANENEPTKAQPLKSDE